MNEEADALRVQAYALKELILMSYDVLVASRPEPSLSWWRLRDCCVSDQFMHQSSDKPLCQYSLHQDLGEGCPHTLTQAIQTHPSPLSLWFRINFCCFKPLTIIVNASGFIEFLHFESYTWRSLWIHAVSAKVRCLRCRTGSRGRWPWALRWRAFDERCQFWSTFLVMRSISSRMKCWKFRVFGDWRT